MGTSGSGLNVEICFRSKYENQVCIKSTATLDSGYPNTDMVEQSDRWFPIRISSYELKVTAEGTVQNSVSAFAISLLAAVSYLEIHAGPDLTMPDAEHLKP